MKRKERKNKIKLLCGLLFLAFLLPLTVSAAGAIDKNKEVTCSLSYQSEGTPLVGAKFYLYLVATVDENGELTKTEPFRAYNVDIRGKNDKAWKTLASTLEGYVVKDKVAKAASGKTNAAGKIAFPKTGKKLKQGLYLLIGERHEQDGYYYDAAPSMVMLPAMDMEKNEWNYHVDINGKFSSEKVPEKGETTSRKVMKIWRDTGYEDKRPTEVEVQLLKNGAVYDTVILNESNQWTYTWKQLDATAKWTLTETAVRRYHVQTEQQGKTFVVTNTYYVLWDEEMREMETDKPEDSDDQNSSGNRLPQTGQLWWPVPILLMAGFFCLVVGAARKRRHHEAE